MAQQANIVQDSVDRVRDAFGSLEDEFQRVQKEMRKEIKSRRRSIQKQLNTSRKDFEKRTKKLRTEIERNSVAKRVRNLGRDAQKQIEQSVDNILGALQIASKSDLQKLDRKLNQVNRKLKELERARKGNGATPTSA